MEKLTITKEMLKNARDYVPEAEKRGFIEKFAGNLLENIKLSLAVRAEGEKERNVLMPEMVAVDGGRRAKVMAAALAALYFNQGSTAADDATLDLWAGSHVMNQLERWKSDAEARGKVFDLLEDYRNLDKRLMAAAKAIADVKNDPVVRQQILSEKTAMALPGLLQQLKAAQNEMKGTEEEKGEDSHEPDGA